MTVRECLKEAMRREGVSEEEHKKRLMFADSNMPMARGITNTEVEPHNVEPMIEGLRKVFRHMKALSPDQKRAFVDNFSQKNRRDIEGN